MKKRKLFCLLPLAGLLLSGCSFSDIFGIFGGSSVDGEWDVHPTLKGGTKAQRTAICEAINDKKPCVNKASNGIYPESNIIMKQDNGDYIKVTTKQVVENYTVELKWGVDEGQATFKAMRKSDDEHDIIQVKYPGFQNPSTQFKWKLLSATCGRAKTTDEYISEYTARLDAESHPHDEMTIAEINKCTMTSVTKNGHTYPSTFDMVNYERTKPYFYANETDETASYHYVAVRGKVIFYAPDGNWALLGDGDQAINIFASSQGKPILPANFPDLNDEYVEVRGNLSAYRGSIQVSFITDITSADKTGIADPVVPAHNITPEFMATNFDLPSPFTCQRQAIDGFSSSMGKITGTVVPNTIKDKNDAKIESPSAIKSSERFVFDVDLGSGRTISVAYDYHTDREGSLGLFDKLKSKALNGGSISLIGTMRYNNFIESDKDNPTGQFCIDDKNGVWQIVPILADQVQ